LAEIEKYRVSGLLWGASRMSHWRCGDRSFSWKLQDCSRWSEWYSGGSFWFLPKPSKVPTGKVLTCH